MTSNSYGRSLSNADGESDKLVEPIIKNQDSIIRIFKVVSWLDSARWGAEQGRDFITFCRDDLRSPEKILTHWIGYVTDRQMPYEIVWEKGGYVFSDLVFDYVRQWGLPPKQILDEHYEDYRDNTSRKRFRFTSKDGAKFASRFVTDDYQNILQTLEILDQRCNRSFMVYIADLMRKYQTQNDLFARIACGLGLLTYRLDGKKANAEAVILSLDSKDVFAKELEAFKKTSTTGKKRLWCCVRDYRKGLYHDIFENALVETFGNDAKELIGTWNNLPMDEMELPGDVWNNSPLLSDGLLADALCTDRIPKSWGMPRVIRNVYNQLRSSDAVEGFYPEQFDITVDFVPRMCAKKMCHVCPFGAEGVDRICIPTDGKYCPVALTCCGYTAYCDSWNCIVKENIGKGVCRTLH